MQTVSYKQLRAIHAMRQHSDLVQEAKRLRGEFKDGPSFSRLVELQLEVMSLIRRSCAYQAPDLDHLVDLLTLKEAISNKLVPSLYPLPSSTTASRDEIMRQELIDSRALKSAVQLNQEGDPQPLKHVLDNIRRASGLERSDSSIVAGDVFLAYDSRSAASAELNEYHHKLLFDDMKQDVKRAHELRGDEYEVVHLQRRALQCMASYDGDWPQDLLDHWVLVSGMGRGLFDRDPSGTLKERVDQVISDYELERDLVAALRKDSSLKSLVKRHVDNSRLGLGISPPESGSLLLQFFSTLSNRVCK